MLFGVFFGGALAAVLYHCIVLLDNSVLCVGHLATARTCVCGGGGGGCIHKSTMHIKHTKT